MGRKPCSIEPEFPGNYHTYTGGVTPKAAFWVLEGGNMMRWPFLSFRIEA
ncbi:MAG: hypothetical protein LBU07_00860 [Coriobacteriales bacterium]|jgi:hypothetical protein|nr:hypothetical protein [Coriobacteriales bacterium]